MKRLITIQQGLRVTKDKSGDGGRFKFRSAEDIFEKAKPLLAETNTAVVVTDELTEIGGRCAIKATASLIGDNGVIATASGWACMDSHTVSGVDRAGNPYTKKTMSNEQCTGSASSYARKYALCGLFAIDNDENDPDQPNIQPASETPAQPKQPTNPAPQKPAAQPANGAQAKPTAKALSRAEIEAYMALCADIDACENLEQLKTNAERAKGTPYEKQINAHAIKVATQKGWYNPQEKK